MKCPSLFHFYRAYYGGESQGKVYFAKAIVETNKQLALIFTTQDENGIQRYLNREFGYGLTKGFLTRFDSLAKEYYGEHYLQELQWLEYRITIPKEIISTKELYIPFSLCYDATENRIIFIEFGKVQEAYKWLPIFKSLVESFILDYKLPSVTTVTYWDLMKGGTMELSYEDSFLASKERLVFTARRIIEMTRR